MISVIIPTLNEANHIGKLLNHLTVNASCKNISEIIVVDGGSTDQTKDILHGFTPINKVNEATTYKRTETLNASTNLTENKKISFKILDSEKGRAKQMNIGAKSASGSILYFLHADSLPPANFDVFILNEVKKGNLAGCFRMQFDSNHWWLKLASWLTKFSWRACRGGDQSQFISKHLFNTIGGFNEAYIIYEDNILINELYARNEFVVINKKLKTSARLYKKHGVWKLQYIFWSIYVKKWFGANADDLYAYYKRKIN